jgi:hypothetical protein
MGAPRSDQDAAIAQAGIDALNAALSAKATVP